ncbi:MAG: tRNA 2-selenouridine(34) synthase MnmH [Ignavibacteria bacterium]|nr:tRNA 2-selenouridine(34) synthase MnmH [Ignavibacteria bacterium]
MITDLSDKDLFEFIRSADIPQMPPLREILAGSSAAAVTAEELLEDLRQRNDEILLIDARSENEFADSSIPFSKNFPVLDNSERHKVGLIYKKYSKSAALWLAMKLAEPKHSSLGEFLKDNDAGRKDVFVYCWRGGGRSGYLAKMISDLGYSTSVLEGGHKSFRRMAVRFFSISEFPARLVELSGLTGSGKTELLRLFSFTNPAIDLEKSASHYSSLLGRVPYEVKGLPGVSGQSAFENNVFAEIVLNRKEESIDKEVYLIESESRKVGDFFVPEMLYKKMETSPSVRVESSTDCRIARLCRDYFGEDSKSTEPMLRVMRSKEVFFRQQLSRNVYDELMRLLESGETMKFTEIMLSKYYDLRYKDKGKVPVVSVNADEPESALKEIEAVCRRYKSG